MTELLPSGFISICYDFVTLRHASENLYEGVN